MTNRARDIPDAIRVRYATQSIRFLWVMLFLIGIPVFVVMQAIYLERVAEFALACAVAYLLIGVQPSERSDR